MSRCLTVVVIAIGASLLRANPPAQVVIPAQAVVVPYYTATYQPQDSHALLAPDLLRQILAELKALRAELTAMRGQQPIPAPMQPPAPLAALNVLQTRCAACHAQAVSNAKGGEFALLGADEKITVLSLAEKRRIQARIVKDQMPPPPAKPLPAAEKQALIEWLNRMESSQ